MKQAVLVIIKPDGVTKQLVGDILNRFALTKLDVVAIRLAKASKELAESHYRHIKGQPFFDGVVAYLLGQYHKKKKLWVMILCGENAIKKCRKVAGATNPEEAEPTSIRGALGRITTKGVFENVVHVSSNSKEAEREIKLWFEPEDIDVNLFPVKIKQVNSFKKRVWA